MQKRNVIAHAAAIGLLIAASLGIFQAVGAASNTAIASSKKFAGPTEPPSSWYAQGLSDVISGENVVVATPANGAGLVVQSISYANDGDVPGLVDIYPDAVNDPDGVCEHTVASFQVYDFITVPASGSVTKNFEPGISIPAGQQLCAGGDGSTIIVSVTGYNIPGTPGAQPTTPHALPKLK
jgi:hypothetical protein